MLGNEPTLQWYKGGGGRFTASHFSSFFDQNLEFEIFSKHHLLTGGGAGGGFPSRNYAMSFYIECPVTTSQATLYVYI